MKELIGELELNRIYQRDCIEGMRMLPDNSVDLIVIDPPYNIGKDARWDKWETFDEYVKFMSDVFVECERVLKPNGSFYWFHNDMAQLRKLMDAMDDTSFVFKQFIVWNKRFEGARNKGFLDGFIEPGGLRNYQLMVEYCLFYTLQDEYGANKAGFGFTELRDYFRQYQEALDMSIGQINKALGSRRAEHAFYWKSTQWDLPTRETYEALLTVPVKSEFIPRNYDELKREYEDSKYTYNNLRKDHSVWNYEIAPKQGHVTPKPVELIENIIRHSSNEGDIVLDCFMGSGTTAVAAVRNSRKFIGFERESEYVEMANKRLDNEMEAD